MFKVRLGNCIKGSWKQWFWLKNYLPILWFWMICWQGEKRNA